MNNIFKKRSFVGTMFRNKNDGYVLVNDDVHVVDLDENTVVCTGDKVVVSLNEEGHCVVTNVLTNSKKRIEGVVEKVNQNDCYLKIKNKETIIKLDASQVEDGDKIIYNQKKDKIVAYLGNIYEPDDIIKEMAIINNFNPEFSEEILINLDKFNDVISDEEYSKRIDLRKETIFTIDGSDARDLDDAISLYINSDGNYMLGVHIADVSHFVKPGSIIDKEAAYRATSLYYSDRVIPMLPKRLSNELCSLNPNVDRLAISVFMEISPTGDLIDTAIMKSVINSNKKMVYKDVNKILDTNYINNEYVSFADNLYLMNKLAKILIKRKNDAGKFSFDKEEIRFVLNQDSFPVDMRSKKHGTSESMIEIFMITCNEAVAAFTERESLANIYRIHNIPDTRKVVTLAEFLNSNGYTLDVPLNNFSSKDIVRLMGEISGLDNATALQDRILSTLPRAEYKERVGMDKFEETRDLFSHFGLASDKYTHFTSPIRRYADLIVHQILSDYLDDKYLSKQKQITLLNTLKATVKHINEQERNADSFVADVQHYQMCQYYSDKIGEECDALIVNIDSSGLRLKLDNGLPARVFPEHIEGDNIKFNRGGQKFIDLVNSNEFKFGDMVVAKVLVANPEVKKLRFGIKVADKSDSKIYTK